MFELYADKNKLTVLAGEELTSGSVNVYQARFRFSDDWEGLSKTAVFRLGCKEKLVLLDSGGECTVPWEVLTEPGWYLMAGVCGRRGEETVLPTVWANLGQVREGAGTGDGEPSAPPTPDIWRQALDAKGDGLGYTEAGELGLYSGGRLLSSVPVKRGGDEDGADHRKLINRDAEEQHPISAITGLEAELDRIPEPVEALKNNELEEMLK